jgi:mono/diheme cytochrome c family protein
VIARTAQIAGAAVILAALSAIAALPQTGVKRMGFRPIASARGVDIYRAYCANCHGDDGKGHGPDAAGLNVPMPDLTTITARNGGNFSVGAVEESINRWKQVPRTMTDVIEGQEGKRTGQTSLAMPAFGPIFAKLYPQEVGERRMRMANLISYVKSLQVASAPGEKK